MLEGSATPQHAAGAPPRAPSFGASAWVKKRRQQADDEHSTPSRPASLSHREVSPTRHGTDPTRCTPPRCAAEPWGEQPEHGQPGPRRTASPAGQQQPTRRASFGGSAWVERRRQSSPARSPSWAPTASILRDSCAMKGRHHWRDHLRATAGATPECMQDAPEWCGSTQTPTLRRREAAFSPPPPLPASRQLRLNRHPTPSRYMSPLGADSPAADSPQHRRQQREQQQQEHLGGGHRFPPCVGRQQYFGSTLLPSPAPRSGTPKRSGGGGGLARSARGTWEHASPSGQAAAHHLSLRGVDEKRRQHALGVRQKVREKRDGERDGDDRQRTWNPSTALRGGAGEVQEEEERTPARQRGAEGASTPRKSKGDGKGADTAALMREIELLRRENEALRSRQADAVEVSDTDSQPVHPASSGAGDAGPSGAAFDTRGSTFGTCRAAAPNTLVVTTSTDSLTSNASLNRTVPALEEDKADEANRTTPPASSPEQCGSVTPTSPPASPHLSSSQLDSPSGSVMGLRQCDSVVHRPEHAGKAAEKDQPPLTDVESRSSSGARQSSSSSSTTSSSSSSSAPSSAETQRHNASTVSSVPRSPNASTVSGMVSTSKHLSA